MQNLSNECVHPNRTWALLSLGLHCSPHCCPRRSLLREHHVTTLTLESPRLGPNKALSSWNFSLAGRRGSHERSTGPPGPLKGGSRGSPAKIKNRLLSIWFYSLESNSEEWGLWLVCMALLIVVQIKGHAAWFIRNYHTGLFLLVTNFMITFSAISSTWMYPFAKWRK